MKILWITNIPLPPACGPAGIKSQPMGGWMLSSLQSLSELRNDLSFAVATAWNGRSFETFEIDGIIYYLLPKKGCKSTKYNKKLEPYWKHIKREFHPDIVHVHGSEYPYGLAYINACGANNVMVSLQGIISGCARYYTAGIDFSSLKKTETLRNFILRDSVLEQQKDFIKRSKLEEQFLKSIKYVAGRTNWDKAHAYAINPEIEYLHCNETLRPEFYKHNWQYETCEPYSILISQAGYPIKGAHIVIKALALVKKQFPDAKLIIPGTDITCAPWYLLSNYGNYLKKLIHQLNLQSSVEFTGPLNEQQMCNRFLKCNVFVCPSSIENSPNSLGEAQLLNVPYLASNVGGVADLVGNNDHVLYRFEEYEVLAEKLCSIFKAKGEYLHPESGDLSRYNSVHNAKQLLSIYNHILEIRKERE